MNINKQTELCDLPSAGKLYSGSLSSGAIELRYPTTEQEDILTNSNYIKQGTVIDKLLQSVIATEGFNYKDLLSGDKNSIMVATRILLYGSEYKFTVTNPYDETKVPITINLGELKEQKLGIEPLTLGVNEFEFTTPKGDKLTFKMLTHGDEDNIEAEIKGLKKIKPNESKSVTTRLVHTILSINGKKDQASIREYVKTMSAHDARALREYINKNSPNVELKWEYDFGNGIEEVSVPVTTEFFWP